MLACNTQRCVMLEYSLPNRLAETSDAPRRHWLHKKLRGSNQPAIVTHESHFNLLDTITFKVAELATPEIQLETSRPMLIGRAAQS
jgi:hypothetical protein